mgnify:CR=1 FL=1
MEIEGLSLSGASETLRADKEVVIAAVTNNGCAIQFADPSLQGNYEVAKIAISERYQLFPELPYQLQHLQYQAFLFQ